MVNRKPDFLHRRVLKHPFTILVLLCIGVFLVGSTFQTKAETINVTATVPAPPLTQPAVITSPHDGQHVSADQQTVMGTCPDASYVKLYLNDHYAGVSQCTVNTFSVPVVLLPGANSLQARVFNITDSEGPTSSPITVYYDVPPSPTNQTPGSPVGGGGSTGQTPSSARSNGVGLSSPVQSGTGSEPLRIIDDYHYQAHFVGELWNWNVRITGGVGTYKVTVDWGDRRSSVWHIANGSSLTLSHAYESAGSFTPLITVTDEQGTMTVLQLSAVVRASPGLAQTIKLSPFDELRQYLWVIWPVYVLMLLLALSYWLGEQEILNRRRHHHSK